MIENNRVITNIVKLGLEFVHSCTKGGNALMPLSSTGNIRIQLRVP